jgi:hypothetical protein
MKVILADDDVVAGLQAGADDYMTKPFDQEELFARLQVGVRVLSLQENLTQRVHELADALTRVKQLQGLLPICCYCKNVRTDNNYWQEVEHYFGQFTDVEFSHGICPRCYHEVVEPELERMNTTPATQASPPAPAAESVGGCLVSPVSPGQKRVGGENAVKS